MGRLWRVAPLVGASWFGLLGCASSGDSFSADLDRLRSEVASLKSQNAAFAERLGAVESASRAPSREQAGTDLAPATSSRPKLEVVRLAPAELDLHEGATEVVSAAPLPPAAPSPRVRYRTTSKGIVEELVPHDEGLAPRGDGGTVVAQAKAPRGASTANRPPASPAGRSQ